MGGGQIHDQTNISDGLIEPFLNSILSNNFNTKRKNFTAPGFFWGIQM